jgi:hypothetical protein
LTSWQPKLLDLYYNGIYEIILNNWLTSHWKNVNLEQWFSAFFCSRNTIIHHKFSRHTHALDTKNFGYALRYSVLSIGIFNLFPNNCTVLKLNNFNLRTYDLSVQINKCKEIKYILFSMFLYQTFFAAHLVDFVSHWLRTTGLESSKNNMYVWSSYHIG